MRRPSTDDLIQWAAHKWRIPENWLRAEYVVESYWNQFQLGDDTRVSSRSYRLYPNQSRIPNTSNVYQSLGITQVRWTPSGSLGPGTEPLRWESTAFNVDEQAATLRFYYDNPSGARSSWATQPMLRVKSGRASGRGSGPTPGETLGRATTLETSRDASQVTIGSRPAFWGGPLDRSRADSFSGRATCTQCRASEA